MTPYVASIAIDSVIDALSAFLQPFVPGEDIVRGQNNRTPPPLNAFVVLTEILIVDLETATVTRDVPNAQSLIYGPARIDVQIDFYGPSAGDQCKAVKTVIDSALAYTLGWPDGIKPLYCSDGLQAAMVTGEEQYESRFTSTASLQYNPVVALPVQFAHELALNILEDIQ